MLMLFNKTEKSKPDDIMAGFPEEERERKNEGH